MKMRGRLRCGCVHAPETCYDILAWAEIRSHADFAFRRMAGKGAAWLSPRLAATLRGSDKTCAFGAGVGRYAKRRLGNNRHERTLLSDKYKILSDQTYRFFDLIYRCPVLLYNACK